MRRLMQAALMTFLLVLAEGSAHAAIDPATVQKLVAADGNQNDLFGQSVSLSADGNTVLIGADEDWDKAQFAGSAYVFVKGSDGRWSQQTKLTAKDGAENDGFGCSVSLSADGSTALVGAFGDDDKAETAGSAYVFVKGPDGDWSQQAKLTAKDGAAGDLFGYSLSVSGDGDTAVIGAYGDDDKGDISGSAYVFVRAADGSWSQQTKLTAKDGAQSNYFGFSVSLSADGGVALIGAGSNDDKRAGISSAYVFVKGTDGSWSQQAKLTAKDGKEWDWFGSSVSLSADGGAALIGAGNDENGISSCSAYLFMRAADGSWSQQAKLTAKDGEKGDFFGGSVSLSADGGTALIGATGDDDKGISSGSAYLFMRAADGTWSQQTKLTAKDGEYENFFGGSVSLSADGGTALAGARYDNDKGSHSGSAYLFSSTPVTTSVPISKMRLRR